MKISDEELMLKVKEGNEEAFELLVERHYVNVLNFICKFMGNRDIAEDLCQDTFLRLWRSAGTYLPISKFTTFLYHIAKNVCLSEIAKIRRRPEMVPLDTSFTGDCSVIPPADEIEDRRYSPEKAVLAAEMRKRIQDAIASLSEEHRLVFILTEFHGMSYQQVAEIAQCPVGTVASRKNAAVRQLRRALERYLT